MAASPLNPSAFPNSPYAAELQRGASNRRFSPKLEAEYIREHLLQSCGVIRAACTLAMLLAAFHVIQQILGGVPWGRAHAIQIGLVLAASITLTSVAWSSAFERFYLPLVRIVVPVRNSLAAVPIATAAAHGRLETLMVLPLMVLGPFFFLGLSFRVALLSVVLTFVSFIVSATVFGVALPIELRSCAFLLIVVVACAVAARHIEKWSRTSFLESHLIAELAQHDALTGTKNRRVFDEELTRLWQHAIEYARTIAILLIDVDHFKAYNDRYGHQAGDRTLRQVAETLQTFISRPLDVLARYGGEEFAVILYDVDDRQAEALADRMRRAVSELATEDSGSPIDAAVTISVGVAVIEPSRERQPRGALQLADQALYEAKLRGRNRIELKDDAEHRLMVTGIFSTDWLRREQ